MLNLQTSLSRVYVNDSYFHSLLMFPSYTSQTSVCVCEFQVVPMRFLSCPTVKIIPSTPNDCLLLRRPSFPSLPATPLPLRGDEMSHYSNSSSMKHGPEGREREVNGSGWVRRQVKGQTENGKGQSGNLGSGRVDTLVKLKGWNSEEG